LDWRRFYAAASDGETFIARCFAPFVGAPRRLQRRYAVAHYDDRVNFRAVLLRRPVDYLRNPSKKGSVTNPISQM
jgi:hypothetical protein